MSAFERIDGHVDYAGKFIRVGVERFRHEDGTVVSRDKVWHPGAVGVLAIDDQHVWLTRQPREAAGLEASLEVPAGKLDVPGEPPLQCAQRELAEEVGKHAEHWEEICSFLTSPGFSDERVWLYLASGLSDSTAGATPDEDERIEVVAWPLRALDQAIAESDDSKTLIALLWLARRSGARRRE